MTPREALKKLVDAIGLDDLSNFTPEQVKAIHVARILLAEPDMLVIRTVTQMVERLNTQHPSRRGVKRHNCALDMLSGAAMAAYHSGSNSGFNSFAHLAIMVATRGADELRRFVEVEL